MDKRSILLKSISCKGISSPIPFQTPSLYASVSLSGTSQRHQTPVDSANGENPEWECPMRFDLSSSPSDGQDLFLEFNLTAQVPLLGDRLVGTARIHISDLFDGEPRGHVSYQVQWPDGKPNGTIQLWYRIEGAKQPSDMAYYSAVPSAPPAPDFSYKPPVEPGSGYPTTLPGTVSHSSQPVNTVPACYPPVSGSASYNSEPVNLGSGEPYRVNGTHNGAEFMPYPPPSTSGLYPPLNSGFGSLAPCYPPPKTHNPPMDSAASGSPYYPPPGPSSSGLYPPPNSGFGSMSPYYPPHKTYDRPVDPAASGSPYYPPPGIPNPPVHHAESGRTYYPPPGTQYPPAMGTDCCDCEHRKAEEPVLAYPAGNGYYPPPPRYPHY